MLTMLLCGAVILLGVYDQRGRDAASVSKAASCRIEEVVNGREVREVHVREVLLQEQFWRVCRASEATNLETGLDAIVCLWRRCDGVGGSRLLFSCFGSGLRFKK